MHKHFIAYSLMLLGLGILIAGELFAPKIQQQIWLTLGLCLLMAGVYAFSKKIPPKQQQDFDPPLVITEKNSEKNKHE